MPSTPGVLTALSLQSLQAISSSLPSDPRANRHSVISTTSTASFGSTASVSSSVAQRRFWSLSPSSPSVPSSPPSRLSPIAPASPASPSPRPRSRRSHHIPSQRVTYLTPLVDAAARTQPWQPSLASLTADLRWLAHVVPAVVVASLTIRPATGITGIAEAILQVVLAIVVAAMLIFLPLLWACLPGLLWAAWLALVLASMWLLSAPLNGGPTVAQPWVGLSTQAVPDSLSGLDGPDPKETWLFVSGMGETSRSLAKTLPRLAAVCGRPVTLVRPGRSYGLACDLVVALAHRWLPGCLPSPAADRLSQAIHAALDAGRHDGVGSRVVILAHNAGASAVARALPRLLADVPSAWLARLEIYTFGVLAPDFGLPPAHDADIPRLPHVEHFALAQDPCARFGLLRSVRERDVRYCGSVAVLGTVGESAAHVAPTSAPPRLLRMEDYLTALLGPEPWSMRPDCSHGVLAGHGRRAGYNTCFLDAVVCVDRELVERREILACFSSPVAASPRSFSWTGLGAMAAGAKQDAKNDPDGLQGLQAARRRCRASDGRSGREVSRLATYYAEAVLWHQERFGPLPGLR